MPRLRHRSAFGLWTGWQARTGKPASFGDPVHDEAFGGKDWTEWQRRPDIPGDTFVYFARAGDSIKIGISNNVAQRLRDIQTTCPEKVHLIGVIVGNRKLEGILHRRFKEHHIRGEWFRLEILADLLEMVAADEGFWQAA